MIDDRVPMSIDNTRSSRILQVLKHAIGSASFELVQVEIASFVDNV